MRTLTTVAVSLLAICVVSDTARSAEGGFFSGPIGGSDVRSALLGTPDSLMVSGVITPQWSNLFTGDDGDPSPSHRSVAFSANNLTGSLNYVYPWTLDGGKFATKIQDGYSFGDYRSGSREEADSGNTDPYLDALLYSKYLGLFGVTPPPQTGDHLKLPYGLTIAPAMSFSIPVGRYRSSDLLNQGHNALIFVPNIAFTYITGPNWSFGDATEIDMRFYYEISADNPATGYRNGDVFVDDVAFTQRVHYWQFGIAGTVAVSTNDDTRHGIALPNEGNKLFDFLIGPVIQLDVPKWHASFGLKGLYDAVSHNRLDHNLALFRATFTVF